jgi:PIN domain nuclease of toxin-antitoxin system
MQVIIDTHILIWYTQNSSILKTNHIELINDGHNEIFYSIASLIELTIKIKKEKLMIDKNFQTEFDKLGFVCLPFNLKHWIRFNELPLIHNDPFDRMIISQALSEELPLISYDNIFKNYESLIII